VKWKLSSFLFCTTAKYLEAALEFITWILYLKIFPGIIIFLGRKLTSFHAAEEFLLRFFIQLMNHREIWWTDISDIVYHPSFFFRTKIFGKQSVSLHQVHTVM
jgi:hypothetical protein